ncbi:MAG TPA: hypothetical protein VGI34_04870 [Candidatus Acidoferrales bacterium]|jgi:hypothetical protein
MAGQKHLGYSRALGDLRTARALLQRGNAPQTPNEQDEVSLAIANIDGAISEITKAAGGNAGARPEIAKSDLRMSWAQRLSKSFRMLDKAKLDCSTEKENSSEAGLQKRVLDRIDEAHDRIQVAINTVNFDYSARNMPTRND